MEKKELIIKEVKNTGLDITEPVVDTKDYHSDLFKTADEKPLGAFSPLVKPEIVFSDGKGWQQVALDYGNPEKQLNDHFDTYCCVIYSIAKSLCYYLFKVYGISVTISEMYNAFYAGVVPNRGTTIRKGLESFRKNGWVGDSVYPFTPNTTINEFFKRPPDKIRLKALDQLEEWDFHWEVLPRNLTAIKEAYKRYPVVLTGFAWASYYGEGVYYDNGNPANHAFLGLECGDNGNNLIDDTYPRDRDDDDVHKDELFKELHNSFRYGSAHVCWLTPTNENHKLSIKYVMNMLKKVARDIQGGFWFIKDVNGIPHKQKITGWESMLGSLIDEIGVEKNNLTEQELSVIPDYQFFGK